MPTQSGGSLNRNLSDGNTDGTTIGQSPSEVITINGQLVLAAGASIFPNTNAFLTQTITSTIGVTLTPSQMIGTSILRSGPTAAFTDTMPTAANIILGLQAAGVPQGSGLGTFYNNQTAFVCTLGTNTGVTFNGPFIVPPYSSAYFQAVQTSATAVIINFIAVNPNNALSNSQFTANAGASPLTLSAASCGGGYSDCNINLTATLAAGGTVTLPTVATLVAAIPNAVAGMGWNLRIINSSSANFAWTTTTNTGWTLVGTMTIAQNTTRDFIITLNSLTTATLQQVGTGTTS